jgi:Rad3-related DNA helicase
MQTTTSNPPTMPLDAEDFRETVVQRYADEVDDVSLDSCIGAAVDAVWPAPEYREHQRQAVVDVLKGLYVADDDVVTLSAPTGAGKSLILHAVMSVIRNEADKDSFFSTPLNALIDQVDNDEFIADEVVTLKGKNNYQCVHRQDRGAPVDKAVCQRVSDFDCEHKDVPHTKGGCPYYGRKEVAKAHPEVVTNLSYLMANAMIPDEHSLSARELVVVDECQSIEDFALNFVGVTVNENTIPVVWESVSQPPRNASIDQYVDWLEMDVFTKVERKLADLDDKPELTENEADQQEDLQQFARKVRNFVSDYQDHHWVVETEWDDGDWDVSFEPIRVGRFLDSFLWSQGNKVVLSSATVPKGGFMEDVGLDDRDVTRVEVESTFPPERRGVYTDDTVGKMTYGERDTTIPKMARKIADIADHHDGQRGFVHCHSYSIASRLYDNLPADVKERTRVQDGGDREQSLEDWLAADTDERGFAEDAGGQVFLSVAMDEGISLDDWRARWQVIAKAAYPFMGAERVDYRLNELDDWTWYCGKAAINLQQAVGRGMRSADDWCHTYVLDTSAADMIERNQYLFEDWFLEAVDVEHNLNEDRA